MDVPKTGPFGRDELDAENPSLPRRFARSILQLGRRRLGTGGVQTERARDVAREGARRIRRRFTRGR